LFLWQAALRNRKAIGETRNNMNLVAKAFQQSAATLVTLSGASE
jgi:hypothetical protein